MSRFVHARAAIFAVVVIGTLFAAACSGSSGNAATASNASSAAPSSGAAFQAYRDCLSQHGVTLPTRPRNQSDSGAPPGSGSDQSGQGRGGGGLGGGFNGQFSLPPGVDQGAFDAAQQACAGLRPTGNGGRGGAAAAAYRSCLADHGVTVPSTSSGGPPPSIDRNDPNFAAANDACRALLPNRGTNGSTGSDASSSSTASTAG